MQVFRQKILPWPANVAVGTEDQTADKRDYSKPTN